MDFLKSVGNHIVNAFRFPKPYNWGYPVFFGSVGMGLALLLLKLMFSGAFEFSSTSLKPRMVRRSQLIFFSGCSVCSESWATVCNVTMLNTISTTLFIGSEFS